MAEQASESDDRTDSPGRTRLRALGRFASLAALMVLAPIGFYYVFYFSAQTERFARQDFAVLESVGRSLATSLALTREVACFQAHSEHAQAPLAGSVLLPLTDATDKQSLKGTCPPDRPEGERKRERKSVRENFPVAMSQWRVSELRDLPFDSVLAYRTDRNETPRPATFLSRADRRDDLADAPPIFFDRDGRKIDPGEFETIGFQETAGAASESEEKFSLPGFAWLADLPRARVGTSRYLAFHIELALIDYESNVRIVGLVDEARFREEALALPSTALVLGAAVLALIVLMLPYLRIRFLERRQRLRRADMWSLAISTGVLVALGTLVAIGLSARHMLFERADEGLAAAAQAGVRAVDQGRSDVVGTLCGALPWMIEELARGERVVPNILAAKQLGFLDFEVLSLFGSNGDQLKKWIVRGQETRLINSGDAAYFRRGMEMPHRAGADCERTAAFDSVDAPTTGLPLAAFTLPWSRTAEGDGGAGIEHAARDGVALIAAPFRSLTSPPIPFPYEFVVVDPDGTTLFRSNGRRTAGENFFTQLEPEGTDWVPSAIGTDRARDVRYRGRMHRMTVRNLGLEIDPSTGRSPLLIAYYEKDLFEDVTALSMEAAAASLGIVAIAAIGLALVARLTSRKALGWLWPTRDSNRSYIRRLSGLIIVLAVGILLRAELAGTGALLAILLVLAALFFVCWSSPRREPGRPAALYPWSYIASIVALLMLVAAFPTLIAFHDSFELHNQGLRRLLDERSQDRIESLGAARLSRFAEVAASPTQELSDRLARSELIPVSVGALAEEQRENPARESRFPRPQRGNTGAGWPVLFLGGDNAQRSEIRAASRVSSLACRDCPTFVESSRLGPEAAGLVLIAVLSWLAIANVARRILGLDIEGDGLVEREGDTQGLLKAGKRTLLIRPKTALVQELRTAPGLLDLEGKKPGQVAHPTPGNPLVLLGLEAVLTNIELHTEVLGLLRSAERDGVVVVSAVEPVRFLASRADNGVQAEEYRSALADWADVFSRYEKVRQKLDEDWLPKPAEIARQNHFALIERECRATEQLQEIGKTIFGNPKIDKLSAPEIIELVHDAAYAHYETIWARCSVDERLLLVQLAHEGVVNPRQFDVLARLRRHHLVLAEPRFMIMNQSFRRFVLEKDLLDNVASYEPAFARSLYASVQGPLVGVAAVAVGLLVFTQQAAVEVAIGAAGTAAGAMALIRQIVEKMDKSAPG